MDTIDVRVRALRELHAFLHDPMFDGRNIEEMTADELHAFARERVARAKTELERQQIKEDNEMLAMRAYAIEMGYVQPKTRSRLS